MIKKNTLLYPNHTLYLVECSQFKSKITEIYPNDNYQEILFPYKQKHDVIFDSKHGIISLRDSKLVSFCCENDFIHVYMIDMIHGPCFAVLKKSKIPIPIELQKKTETDWSTMVPLLCEDALMEELTVFGFYHNEKQQLNVPLAILKLINSYYCNDTIRIIFCSSIYAIQSPDEYKCFVEMKIYQLVNVETFNQVYSTPKLQEFYSEQKL